MSDEEHHFESKADAGASKTYPQQAGTIRKNGYIVIKARPCKVVHNLSLSLFFSFFQIFKLGLNLFDVYSLVGVDRNLSSLCDFFFYWCSNRCASVPSNLIFVGMLLNLYIVSL